MNDTDTGQEILDSLELKGTDMWPDIYDYFREKGIPRMEAQPLRVVQADERHLDHLDADEQLDFVRGLAGASIQLAAFIPEVFFEQLVVHLDDGAVITDAPCLLMK